MNPLPYELALELKEAGFPQKGKGETFGVRGGEGYVIGDTPLVSGDYYLPILSELIEACRKPVAIKPEPSVLRPGGEWSYEVPFDTLMFLDGQWHAGRSFVEGFDFGTLHGSGPTPEEAVARLYLQLHGKPTN